MISVIIPTKNEPYINELIKDINKKLGLKHEIIVVDKSDNKPEIYGARLLLQKSNGLGNAVLEGLAEAKGEYIVMMDGDGSHDPAYVTKMYTYIKKYPIVMGSKFIEGGKTTDKFYRIFVSKFFNFTITRFLGLNVKDAMSGFAMFDRKIFHGLSLKPKGYKLLLEIMYKTKAPVKEIPIVFQKRKAGKSKASAKEVWRLICLTFSLRFGLN